MAVTSRERESSGPALIPAGELSGKPPIALTRPIIVIGSRDTCRIHLISRTVSKAHALLVVTRHTVFLRDLCSREGTFVNGDRIGGDVDLNDSDLIRIGRFEFIFTSGGAKLRPHRERAAPPGAIAEVIGDAPPVPLERRVTLIGRKNDADIRFTEPTVSAAHAVIVAWEGKRYIRDLGSRTGTFVNGKQIHQQELRPLDQIRIGESDLVYEVSQPGEAGVVVVESPTESTVAKALPAQELPPLEVVGADDTLALDEQPAVEEPASRAVQAHRQRPASPTEANVSAETDSETIRAAEQSADDTASGLSRRGWHRTSAGALDEVDSATVEPSAPHPQPHAQPPAEPEMDALEEVAAAAEAQALAEAELASVAPSIGEDLTPPETTPDLELPIEPEATSPVVDTDPVPTSEAMEEEAAAAAEAARTTTETTVAAEASLDDTPVERTSVAETLPLTEPRPIESLVETEASPKSSQPFVNDEVVDETLPSPDSAQPLETLAVADETSDLPGLAVTADLVEPPPDTLSDTALVREVSALTETSLGDPVIAELPVVVEPVVASTDAVEPPTDSPIALEEVSAPSIDIPPVRPADVAELPPPQAIPDPPAEPQQVVEVARDLDLRPEPPPIETVATIDDRRSGVEPTLPLVPPDPAALADDHAHLEHPIEPLPAIGATVARQDVSDPVEMDSSPVAPVLDEPVSAPVESDAPPLPDVEPLPGVAMTPPVETEPETPVETTEALSLSDSQIAAAIGEPVKEAAAEASATVALPPEALVEPQLVEPQPAPEVDEASFTGDLVEIGPVAAGEETAFAVVVPPPPELDLVADAPVSADSTAEDQAKDLPALQEPPTAPEPASNVAHDLGPAPLPGDSTPSVALPSGDLSPESSATIAVPPPLPPDAPPVTEASDDDVANIAVTPTPRRPRVIRDGFARGADAPQVQIPGSPFAGSRGQPVDPFATSGQLPEAIESSPVIESTVTPMDLVQDESETLGGVAAPIPRRVRPVVPPAPKFAAPSIEDPSTTPVVAYPRPQFGGGSEAVDLHELRRRRLRRIPTLAVLSLLLIVLAGAGIWLGVPVYSTFETSLRFENHQARTQAEWRNLQDEQLQKLRNDVFRRAARSVLISNRPNVPGGFMDDPVAYDRVVRQASWPDARPGELVLRYRGSDGNNDRYRLHAMVAALYAENQSRLDEARRVRNAVKELSDSVESNKRKLDDIRQQIERERMLGEARPTPTRLTELETSASELERSWGDALAKLKEAEVEQQRLEKALAAARDNPPPPPDDDAELRKLEKELADLKARYEAAQAGQSAQASVAREELDAAMEAFGRRIEAARGQGAESPELARYIAAAENMQQTTRELIDEFIDRQETQSRRLNELKARFDERSRQRIAEMREGDTQLREMREQRELLRRQLNAAAGSDGQVGADDIAALRERLQLLESAITAREDVLNNDPVYAEAIASLQAIIDQTEQDLIADRRKADQRLDDLQKQFAASSPAVSGLPEEQRKLTQEIEGQLAAVTAARRRYADALDSDRSASERAMKQMQERIVALQGDVDARRKLLTDEFTNKSVAALTSALEAHDAVLTEARELESSARAAFEGRSRELRSAREALALGNSSDERLNRLINDRVETERALQFANEQLQFKRQEERRLVNIVPPTEADVIETPGKDPRFVYMLIAVGVVLAGFGAATWWTIQSAHELDSAFAPEAPEAGPPFATPVPKPSGGHNPASSGSDEQPEHATVA